MRKFSSFWRIPDNDPFRMVQQPGTYFVPFDDSPGGFIPEYVLPRHTQLLQLFDLRHQLCVLAQAGWE
jgi:hypothetical protein